MRGLLAICAGAVAALALWPALGAWRNAAPVATPAPVVRDYQTRDQLIAFFEAQVKKNPRDQIQMRMLAQQYMQRFRERSDFSDVDRAAALAKASIALQPQGNTSAQMTLASALLSYHDFPSALLHEREAWRGDPSNSLARAQIASLDMELGRYGQARQILDAIPQSPAENPGVDAVKARFAELTGKLDNARALIATASRSADSDIGDPAYDRAWYHLRAGQLAFEAGDYSSAGREYDTALADFPDDAQALMWQSRLYLAEHDWHHALDAARRSAELYPLPQTLGYEVDAQIALGDRAGARATDALIGAEARLLNARGVNDRLLALYYADHREHLDAALRAARSDLSKRGDEIYADDTMAWVLTRSGRPAEARVYRMRAMRLGTRDPLLRAHAAGEAY